jgi:hypothetical protein
LKCGTVIVLFPSTLFLLRVIDSAMSLLLSLLPWWC